MHTVGDWVRSKDGHLVGEVVEVRESGKQYLVRSTEVRIETSNLHTVSGGEIEPTSVEDSHLRMALEHLALTCDELVAAGKNEEAERVWALALEFAGSSAASSKSTRWSRARMRAAEPPRSVSSWSRVTGERPG